MTDLQTAKARLEANQGYTCVLQKGEHTVLSAERGVKPLVCFVRSGYDYSGYSAADRVVGRATAFLYVKLGVRALYARVISQSGLAVLRRFGIEVQFDTAVPYIINRKKDGMCPFEEAVLACDDADRAYCVIIEKMRELQIPVS